MLSQLKRVKETRINDKNCLPLLMAQSLTTATRWRLLTDVFLKASDHLEITGMRRVMATKKTRSAYPFGKRLAGKIYEEN